METIDGIRRQALRHVRETLHKAILSKEQREVSTRMYEDILPRFHAALHQERLEASPAGLVRTAGTDLLTDMLSVLIDNTTAPEQRQVERMRAHAMMAESRGQNDLGSFMNTALRVYFSGREIQLSEVVTAAASIALSYIISIPREQWDPQVESLCKRLREGLALHQQQSETEQ